MDKLDIIIQKLESIETRIDRNEEMLGALIKIVGSTNSRVEKIDADSQDFRHEINVHFKRLDRRIKLIESDLDETMAITESLTPPKN